MKRYLTIFIVLFTFVIRVNAEEYKTGDLIKYKDIKFYVVEDKGDYLTLLKATPLTVDELKQYTNYTTTGFPEDYYMGYLRYCKQGNNDGCTFENSNVKAALDNWSKQFGDNDLVESKATYNEYSSSNSTNSVTKSYKVRLLTKNELIQKFEYTSSSYTSSQFSLKTPKWITNYGYFLMDYNNNNYYYSVPEGYYSRSVSCLTTRQESSLRPVINLSKKASITKLKPSVKSINDSEFRIGDIVELNGIEFYVIKNSDKNDKTITMIKTMPLTKKEVETYDSKYTSIGTQYDINDEENDSVDTYKYIPYYYRENGCSKYGDNEQCKNDYESSDIKKIVDMWVNEHIKSSDLAKDLLGYKSRIISVNDLTDNLGYVSTLSTAGNGINNYHQSEAYPFNLMDCWTMTPADDTGIYTYRLSTFNGYANTVHGNEGGAPTRYQGVICPVITINKKVASQENNSSNSIINIPDTLLKNPIFIVVVGIILIVLATVTVSLILKRKK